MAEGLFNFKVLLPILMAISRAYIECRGIGTPGRSILMPVIIWDARNPLFNCPSRGINTIYVHMTDYVNFACPIVGRNLEWYSSVTISYEKMYENGWFLTDEAAALKCNASAQTGSPFINCNDPTKNVGARSIRISKYSEAPGDPQFRYGTTYYLIGTGNGTKSGLVKKVGGRCSGYSDGTELLYNLTLKIHVCSQADEYTDRCPRCFDSACYSKGCGIYGPWQAPVYLPSIINSWLNDTDSIVIQNSTVQAKSKCYRVRERVCDDASRGCAGPRREIKVVECSKVHVKATGGFVSFAKQTGKDGKSNFKYILAVIIYLVGLISGVVAMKLRNCSKEHSSRVNQEFKYTADTGIDNRAHDEMKDLKSLVQ